MLLLRFDDHDVNDDRAVTAVYEEMRRGREEEIMMNIITTIVITIDYQT